MDIPNDLVRLPTQPWDERPDGLPLVVEECRTAIWMSAGNITKAAKILKVSSGRLRAFVNNSPMLTAECNESREQLADISEENVLDALQDSNDPGRRDSMSRFVLASIGKSRGWGTGGGVQASLKLPGSGRMVISWEDDTVISGDDANVIEGEVIP